MNKWGVPVQTAFTILVRDAYTGRCMVRYPINRDGQGSLVEIPDADIAKYLLHDELTRYYSLIESYIAPEDDITQQGGAQMLYLRAPQAVYIDPVGGSDDAGSGFTPTNPAKTLEHAFRQMKTVSSKVLYIMNQVPVTEYTEISNTAFQSDSAGTVTMPNARFLSIRRYSKPVMASSGEGNAQDYQTSSYDGGVLFDVKEGGTLVFSGNMEVNGHGEAIGLSEEDKDHTPDEQKAYGVTSKGPLVYVETGGTLRVELDEETQNAVVLKDNYNTVSEGNAAAADELGGAVSVEAGGTVYMAGGALENNRSSKVTSESAAAGAASGNADGIYSEGTLVVEQNPAGIPQNQGITLNEDAYITMQMLLDEAAVQYGISIMDPYAGRTVVNYDGYSGVDAEHSHYVLDGTVPEELFLVESPDMPNQLELQDWKYLEVEVPEEVFLAVHENHKRDEDGTAYTEVGRADVNGAGYGTPEYTITNNGLYDVRVTATGFVQQSWDTEKDKVTGLQLVPTANAAETTADPVLYLALAASGESAEAGNRFASLPETPLATLGGTQSGAKVEQELGTLKPDEHGSFQFIGQANAGFMDKWLDEDFPASSLELAETRKKHMRSENPDGSTSRNNATAHFKLTYRIELATPRR